MTPESISCKTTRESQSGTSGQDTESGDNHGSHTFAEKLIDRTQNDDDGLVTIPESVGNLGETAAPGLDGNNQAINQALDQALNKNILDVVRSFDGSVRMLNLISTYSESQELPVNTVLEYMKAPEQSRQAFLELLNIGPRLMDELEQVMHDFAENVGDPDSGSRMVMKGNADFERAVQIATTFFSGVFYPDELLEWFPSTRLENLFKADRMKHRISFVDFLKTRDEIVSRLFLASSFNLKGIAQLNQIVTKSIEARLSLCDADSALAPALERLLQGKSVPRRLLTGVIELENINLESIINSFEATLFNETTLSELIAKPLALLDERQRDILERRYGIGRDRDETLQLIGDSLDLTRERVRQIEKRGKDRIRTIRLNKALVAGLKREGTLEKVFEIWKVISEERMKLMKTSLSGEECLAIDLAYGDMGSFLDAEAIQIEAGWVREHDPVLMNYDAENMSRTIYYRIVSAIQEQQIPLSLSRISAALPDYSSEEIRNELSRQFNAEFEGDLVKSCPRLPMSVLCILVLREAGHAMDCSEIRKRILEVFGVKKSNQYIGTALLKLKEALIVESATYDLYENMSFSEDDLEEIRTRVFEYLKSVDGFVFYRTLFHELFRGETERFGPGFGSYMLFGILHHDSRFTFKRRMKIGLAVTL